MHRLRLLVVLAAGVLGVALALGCAPGSSVRIGGPPRPVVRPHHDPGPPPHAPAHGHRHRHRSGHRDVELVFDSGLGVYVVVGIPDHYYWDGHYLRIHDGSWYASVSLDGGWEPRRATALPPGLARKHGHGPSKAKGKKKGKRGRGSAPAKGRW